MSIRSTLLAALVVTSSSWVTTAVPQPPPPGPPGDKVADIVFRNGSIYLVDNGFRKVSALAVKDGIIEAVGPDPSMGRLIGNTTKVVDLKGGMVMPGLIDAHMHVMSGGEFLLKCNLNYQPLPIEGVLAHVQSCIDAEAAGDDAWLEVVNMDWPGLVAASGPVTKLHLDQLTTNRPVMIRSSDYHTVLANSRALTISNITADTPDPSNGVVGRMPGSQEPSGVLNDDASRLLAGPPRPTLPDSILAAKAALKLLREEGITTFQDAAANPTHNAIFNAIKAEDALSARVYLDYRIATPETLEQVTTIAEDAITQISAMNDPSPLGPKPAVKWQAIKAFIDGVITYPTLTAAMIDPYWLPQGEGPNATWAPNGTFIVQPYWEPSSSIRPSSFFSSLESTLSSTPTVTSPSRLRSMPPPRLSRNTQTNLSSSASPTTKSPSLPTGRVLPSSASTPSCRINGRSSRPFISPTRSRPSPITASITSKPIRKSKTPDAL